LKDSTGGKHRYTASQNIWRTYWLLPSNRFTITDPARFRIGDLVELQMNIVAVPVKGGHFKMISQLRTLAQLDCHFSHVRVILLLHLLYIDSTNSKQLCSVPSPIYVNP
jgi:hypothetical protein